jgi:competence protein ComEA
MSDWTQGPARWVAAVVLGTASVIGMTWSLAARRPVERPPAPAPVAATIDAPRDIPRDDPAPGAPNLALAGRIDINTAPAAELELLPGIGPTLAARIVADRAEHGRFTTLDAPERVRGIGPKTVDSLRDMATVGE